MISNSSESTNTDRCPMDITTAYIMETYFICICFRIRNKRTKTKIRSAMTQVALTTVASERVQFTELCGTLTRSREANEGKQSIFCARERGARGKKGNGGLKGRSNDGCRECQMVDQPRCHSTIGLLLLLEKTHTLCHYYGAL